MWVDKKGRLKKFEPFQVGGVRPSSGQKQKQVLSGCAQILGTQVSKKLNYRSHWLPPKIRIIDANMSNCPLSDVPFWKCNHHLLSVKVIAECVQRRVTSGNKNLANEDPQSNDDLGKCGQSAARCSGPAVTIGRRSIATFSSSVSRVGCISNHHVRAIFAIESVSIIALCGDGLHPNEHESQVYDAFQMCLIMVWLNVLFSDAPGLASRMSAIAGMNPPPSLCQATIFFILSNIALVWLSNIIHVLVLADCWLIARD